MFGKQKPLMPRPENERKFNRNDKTDRAVLKTLVLLLGLVMVLIIAIVLVSIFIFGM